MREEERGGKGWKEKENIAQAFSSSNAHYLTNIKTWGKEKKREKGKKVEGRGICFLFYGKK